MQKINGDIGLMALLAISMIIVSCKKDNDNPSPSPGPGAELTTLSGRVTDAEGNPLGGVNVSAGEKSTSTSADGLFSISSVDATSGRIVVKGSKAGYFNGIRGLLPEKNGITKLELVMPAATADFDGITSEDGNFLNNGTGIEIPANSLTTNGAFSAAIQHLSPDDPGFEQMVPGGDLSATDASNNERQLYSYGMLMVKLTDDSGNEINLASGKTATIRMQIAPSQLATAPASIPLWHLDEATGKWKEEGSATRQGNQYVGTVSHFSSWNCDSPGDRATVKGIVKDCKGNPLEGIRVRTGQKIVFTNASGQYQTFVPSGTAFDVAVEYPELGLATAPVAVAPIAEGGEGTVPDISVACPSGIGFMLNCSSGNLLYTSYNISWGQGPGKSVFGTLSGTGKKYINIPSNGQNATYTFQNALTGKTLTGTLILPSQPDTLEKGPFNLCGDTTISNDSLGVSFIINGDGFSNQQISWTGSAFTSYLIYNTTDSLSVYGSVSPGGFTLSGSLTGYPRTGVFTLDDEIGFGLVFPDGKAYVPDSLLTINISQFGNPGSVVRGAFSGRFVRADSQGNIFYASINTGSFKVMRKPNQ